MASVAAGVVLDPLDRARLRGGGFVVWLRARLETLASRVTGTDRPWLGDDAGAAIRRLYAGRADLYAGVADLAVDVDTLPADLVPRASRPGCGRPLSRGPRRSADRRQAGVSGAG